MRPTEPSAPEFKKRSLSLRLRVFGVSLVAMALAIVATGYVLNQLFEQHVRQQYQQQLQVYADYVLTGIELPANGVPQLDQSAQSPRFLQPLSGLYWQLDNDQGKAVLRSRSLWDEQLKVPNDMLATGAAHFHTLPGPDGEQVLLLEQRIRFESVPGRQWRLLVAEDAKPLNAAIRDWQQMLALFLFVLFVFLAMAALAQIVVGFSPLRRLQSSVRQLQAGESSRLEGSYPSEFAGLVQGFNSVLDTNDRVVQRAQAQAGDLAHAIKTPLTVISTALDQSDSKMVSDVALTSLLRDQIAAIREQVDWRLRRARITAEVAGLPGHGCLVEPVLQQMLRVMRKLYADRDIQFELGQLPTGLQFSGQAQDLAEMIGNVLDNAGKWAKAWVKVSVAIDDGRISIDIEDDGPGIDAKMRQLALRRGIRMDERVPGSGLGLAIVNDLVELYQGQLGLQKSRLGGLHVRLELPGRVKPV